MPAAGWLALIAATIILVTSHKSRGLVQWCLMSLLVGKIFRGVTVSSTSFASGLSSWFYKGRFWSWVFQAKRVLKRAMTKMHAPDYYGLNPKEADRIRQKSFKFADIYLTGCAENAVETSLSQCSAGGNKQKPTYDVYEVVFVFPDGWKFAHYCILISGRMIHLRLHYDDNGGIDGVRIHKDSLINDGPFSGNGPNPVHTINYVGKTHYPPSVAWNIGLIFLLSANEKHGLWSLSLANIGKSRGIALHLASRC